MGMNPVTGAPDHKAVVYWAGCDAILGSGPYETEVEAWQAMRLTYEEQIVQKRVHKRGAYVWARRRGDGP